MAQQCLRHGGKVATVLDGGAQAAQRLQMLGCAIALVAGKTITAFTDDEEIAMQLEKAVPFMLETTLRSEGANFVVGPMWAPHVEVDGKLITGQNPASSEPIAQAVLERLR